jgi:hypothetical protein
VAIEQPLNTIYVKLRISSLTTPPTSGLRVVTPKMYAIVAPPDPQGLDLYKLEFPLSGSFCVNLSFSGLVALEKIFK